METLEIATPTAEEQAEQMPDAQSIVARGGLELVIRVGRAQQTDGREFEGEYWQSQLERDTGAYK